MTRTSRRRDTELDEGSILLLTLCVLALLSIMAYGLVTRVRLGLCQEKWIAASSEADLMLRSLAAYAIAGLRKDTDQDSDGYQPEFRVDSGTALADYEGLTNKDNGFVLSIHRIDEHSKFNINELQKGDLSSVIAKAGGGADSAEIANSVVAWRSPDSGALADDDFYESLTPPYLPPHTPFAHIDELLLVRGVTRQLFFGEDADHDGRLDPNEDDTDVQPPDDNGDGDLQPGLMDLLTVYGDDTININTASEAVLRLALGRSLLPEDAEKLTKAILAHRRGADGIDGTEDDKPFSKKDNLPAMAATVLGQERAAEAALAVRGFETTSNVFRFVLKVAIPDLYVVRSAEMVVSREDNDLQIKEWHDL